MNYRKLMREYAAYRRGFSLERLRGDRNVNLGCGKRPLEGFVNTDYLNDLAADVLFDLNGDFPFEDESCDLIYSDNVFEHLSDLISVIDHCYKCLKQGGYLVVRAPYFKSKHAFVDPTHVRFFTVQTLDYFVRGTYFNDEYRFNDNTFDSLSVFLDPEEESRIRELVAFYAVKKPNSFENNILSSFFVFSNIVFVMRK